MPLGNVDKKIPLQARVTRQKKKPNLERGLRPGSAWEALTKKIPATSAGTKLQNKEKPAVRELLTTGLVYPTGFEPAAFRVGV